VVGRAEEGPGVEALAVQLSQGQKSSSSSEREKSARCGSLALPLGLPPLARLPLALLLEPLALRSAPPRRSRLLDDLLDDLLHLHVVSASAAPPRPTSSARERARERDAPCPSSSPRACPPPARRSSASWRRARAAPRWPARARRGRPSRWRARGCGARGGRRGCAREGEGEGRQARVRRAQVRVRVTATATGSKRRVRVRARASARRSALEGSVRAQAAWASCRRARREAAGRGRASGRRGRRARAREGEAVCGRGVSAR